mmetsp:Transcript_9139/g.38452  ORF Transcript_9139/g.38452 Transcript_9139/m.38452 type:complete len:257 (+) Transcript_9139:777-1547(+)
MDERTKRTSTSTSTLRSRVRPPSPRSRLCSARRKKRAPPRTSTRTRLPRSPRRLCQKTRETSSSSTRRRRRASAPCPNQKTKSASLAGSGLPARRSADALSRPPETSGKATTASKTQAKKRARRRKTRRRTRWTRRTTTTRRRTTKTPSTSPKTPRLLRRKKKRRTVGRGALICGMCSSDAAVSRSCAETNRRPRRSGTPRSCVCSKGSSRSHRNPTMTRGRNRLRFRRASRLALKPKLEPNSVTRCRSTSTRTTI